MQDLRCHFADLVLGFAATQHFKAYPMWMVRLKCKASQNIRDYYADDYT